MISCIKLQENIDAGVKRKAANYLFFEPKIFEMKKFNVLQLLYIKLHALNISLLFFENGKNEKNHSNIYFTIIFYFFIIIFIIGIVQQRHALSAQSCVAYTKRLVKLNVHNSPQKRTATYFYFHIILPIAFWRPIKKT